MAGDVKHQYMCSMPQRKKMDANYECPESRKCKAAEIAGMSISEPALSYHWQPKDGILIIGNHRTC